MQKTSCMFPTYHCKYILREKAERMVENDIKKVAKYLKVPVGKLSYTDDHIIQMKTTGDERIVGFSSIINFLHNVVEKENKTSENYFLAKQFFDFANVFIRSSTKRDKCKSSSRTFANSMIFKRFDISTISDAACLELNSYLETRTYLIGQSISLADLVVFYTITDILKQLSPQEKEQYINLSRWFDHLQQQDSIRQGVESVNFSTIHLFGSGLRA